VKDKVGSDDLPYTEGLLDSLGISNDINESDTYSIPEPSLGVHGICPIGRHPLHLAPDLSSLISLGLSDFGLSIYYASIIIHELEHVRQQRAEVPVYSLGSEREADTVQAQFILRALQNFSDLNNHDKEFLLNMLERYAQYCYNYRHYVGYEGHLLLDVPTRLLQEKRNPSQDDFSMQ